MDDQQGVASRDAHSPDPRACWDCAPALCLKSVECRRLEDEDERLELLEELLSAGYDPTDPFPGWDAGRP